MNYPSEPKNSNICLIPCSVRRICVIIYLATDIVETVYIQENVISDTSVDWMSM